jgi:homopolymeric O-antigen transport system permease protein
MRDLVQESFAKSTWGERGAGGTFRARGGAMSLLVRRARQIWAYRTLLKYLVLKDIKVKSRGTYLGIAWTLMNPLLNIGLYFVVFRYIFRAAVPNFLGFFLTGFLMWLFFSRSVSSAVTCIVENDAMIKRSAFPLEVLPLATVLYQLFHYALAMGIALPVMVALWGGRVSWHLAWVVGIAVAFAMFTLAVALWFSVFGVFFRDTRDILEVVLPMLFWATPIFYSPEMAPAFMRPALAANPLSSFLGAMRSAILEGQAPSAGQLASMVLWLTVMLGSGTWVFIRTGPRFAEEL